MSRLISIDSPSAERSRLRRTVAEALRHLMQKKTLDGEAKDLAALIVFCLRELAAGVDRSATAWEKRDYFTKADRFRMEWEWAGATADKMAALIRTDQWHQLPPILASLAPRFADVTINKVVRPPSLWHGCYQRLMGEAGRQ